MICSECHLDKEELDFYLRKNGYYYKYCKKCHIKKGSKNPSKTKERKTEYRLANKDKINKKRMEYNHKNYSEYKISQIKNRIRYKKLNIQCDLVPSDIVVPEFCPVFGIKLDKSNRTSYSAPCVDRIDNDGNYTKNNIVVVSSRANRIKSNGTIEEHIKIRDFYRNLMNPIIYNDDGV